MVSPRRPRSATVGVDGGGGGVGGMMSPGRDQESGGGGRGAGLSLRSEDERESFRRWSVRHCWFRSRFCSFFGGGRLSWIVGGVCLEFFFVFSD